MDKRTLLAVILSVLVMTAGYLVQNKLNPPAQIIENQLAENTETITEEPVEKEIKEDISVSDIVAVDENIPAKEIKVSTDKYDITFNTSGAVISSLILKEYEDYNTEESIEMVNSIDGELSAFNISFDEKYDDFITENFHYNEKNNGVYEFYRDFKKINSDGSLGDSFRLVKTYTLIDNEYLFKLDINIVNSPYRSYSISFGPDIGPTFEKLGRNEFRTYYSFLDGKRIKHKLKGGNETTSANIDWASINGKYFSLIAIPENQISSVTWERDSVESYDFSSELHISNTITSNNTSDSFYFYIGPKDTNFMSLYDNSENNYFGLSESNFAEVIDSSTIGGLGWLSNILKFILIYINKVIPNYGIAIIILTILIKVLFYPITHKSMESTGKMQQIQPKLKKLQDQYKNDPQKLNAATAELYKSEGVNPLGGCLPMLVQMPIFFALYGLLNSYFGLRGAVFIPGWIDNLSAAESVYTLPFSLPILGNAVRVLPVIYLGTQLIMSKITQAGAASSGQSNAQMKMLTLGMPIMFFFILYDMPSGLLVYWTVTNLLTAVQQYFINKNKKKAA